MEVFVNSSTGGVSFLLGCLQVWVSFFSAFVFLCACACACVRGCVRVLVCVAGRTAVYPCTNRSWSLVQSLEFWWMHFLLVVSKSVDVPFFSRDLQPGLALSPLLFPLLPSLSPLSPVVFADPDVFGTTLKFLLKKNTKKDFKNNKKKITRLKISVEKKKICI